MNQLWIIIVLLLMLNDAIVDFTDDNTSDSFKFKEKITGQTGNNDTLLKECCNNGTIEILK